MQEYQKKMIREYRTITGVRFADQDDIIDDRSFWEVWEKNLSWLENAYLDVMTVHNEHLHLRSED